MYALYRSRHLLGWLPSVLAAVFIAWTLQQVPLKIQPDYDAPPVQLALAEPEAEAATPPVPVVETPPPPPTVQPEPEPEVPPVVAEEPVAPPPPPPKPRSEPKPRPKPKPHVEHPKPQPVKPPVATVPQVTAAPRPAPPAPPAPPPKPTVNTGALEGGYLHGVRGDLERYKQYPSGRQASLERPSGKVVVWLLVDRNGKVLDRGLDQRASSMLLNRAALQSLARIEQIKPFPPEAFAGRSQLRITATFDYSPR